MNFNLGAVQETMLIPLVIKAKETTRPNPRIYDYKAVEILKHCNFSTEKFDKFLSHEGVVARTIMFDRELKKFIKQYPSATCINLGCGLDNRFERVDNNKISWYNLDLPDSVSVRNKFFTSHDRVKTIAGSVLEDKWCSEIPKDKKHIFIAEGLFMYFSKSEVEQILKILSTNFNDFILLVELTPPFTTKMSKHHDTVKSTNATFGWGTKSGHELEYLCKGLKLISDTSFNSEMKKHTVRGFLFGTIPFIKNLNNRLAIYEYKSPQANH